MKCPRCKKTHSRELNFYFKEHNVHLVARMCKVCEYLFAEDEEMLKAARAHLKALCKTHLPK